MGEPLPGHSAYRGPQEVREKLQSFQVIFATYVFEETLSTKLDPEETRSSLNKSSGQGLPMWDTVTPACAHRQVPTTLSQLQQSGWFSNKQVTATWLTIHLGKVRN